MLRIYHKTLLTDTGWRSKQRKLSQTAGLSWAWQLLVLCHGTGACKSWNDMGGNETIHLLLMLLHHCCSVVLNAILPSYFFFFFVVVDVLFETKPVGKRKFCCKKGICFPTSYAWYSSNSSEMFSVIVL